MQNDFNLLLSMLLLAGSIFLLLASLGAIKFPDFFTRMAAISKAGTLGAALLLMAPVANEPSLTNFIKSGVALLFLFVTAPVAAHLLGRAAYTRGVRLWQRTLVDEWGAKKKSDMTADPLKS